MVQWSTCHALNVKIEVRLLVSQQETEKWRKWSAQEAYTFKVAGSSPAFSTTRNSYRSYYTSLPCRGGRGSSGIPLKRIDLYLSWLESFADTEEVLGPSPSKSTINGLVAPIG